MVLGGFRDGKTKGEQGWTGLLSGGNGGSREGKQRETGTEGVVEDGW